MSTLPKLALIPSGYKASKVYSALPTNGDGDFTFSRSGTATRVNKNGLIETVDSNVPRLDYSDSNCPTLLLEPQRTNQLRYSEQFDNSFWLKQNTASITPNTTISPNGTLTADTLSNAIGTGINGDILRVNLFYVNVLSTLSVYCKSLGSDNLTIYIRNGSNGSVSSKSISLSNEWQRVELTGNIATGQIFFGNTNGDVAIWGAQLEEGNYATSYIPVTNNAVTRNADVCNNAGNADLFNDSEGVLYAEVSALNSIVDANISIEISNGATGVITNSLYLYLDTTGKYGFAVFSGGTLVCNIKSDIKDLKENAKIAGKYSLNSFDLYLNGVKIGSDTNGNTPIGLSELSFNNGYNFKFYGNCKDLRYYNTALTDTELKQLTTL